MQLILQDPFASLNPVHTARYHLTRSLRITATPGPGRTGWRRRSPAC
ncbi:hypothetical protein V2I01_38215 [Micromonospora sp. BRA006-A]|nr:hypothetical protein [Micromonospora sp. BRA006-A]